MKTILLTDDKIHPEWLLFTPFFYHHQASGQLVLLSFSGWENSEGLSQRILEEIRTNGEEMWQLIVIESMQAPLQEKDRLTCRLAMLRTEVVEKLQQQEAGPENVTVFLLDYIHRNGETEEKDPETLKMLALDQHGCVPAHLLESDEYLCWTDADFAALDAAWGQPVELSTAGPRQKPVPAIRKEIAAKKSNVLQEVEGRISQIRKQRPGQDFYDMDAFCQEFSDRITEETELPLKESIAEFLPSHLAAQLLSRYASQQSELKEAGVIRQEISSHSKKQRYQSWLEVIFFIDLGVENPQVLQSVPKEQVNSFDSEVDQRYLQKMLLTYEASLRSMSEQIETELLQDHSFHVQKFEKTKEFISISNEKTQEDIKEMITASKLKEDLDIRSLDRLKERYDDWIEVKEKEMEISANERLRSLKVSRRKALTTQSEEVELYNYIETLNQLEEEQKLEMEIHTPPPAVEKAAWGEFVEKERFHLQERLKAIPSRKKVVITTLLVWAGITGPLLTNISGWPGGETWPEWALPILTTGAVVYLSILGLHRLDKPVKDTFKDIENEIEMLEQQQTDRHSKTALYLNDYFQLERLKKIKKEVHTSLFVNQRKNMLLRYHLRKTKEALNGFEHLRSFIIEEPGGEKGPLVNASLEIEKDEMNNILFSPVKCMKIEAGNAQDTEITIGKIKKRIHTNHFPIFKRLILDKDQVGKI